MNNRMSFTQKGLSLLTALSLGVIGGLSSNIKTAQADTYNYGGAILVQQDSLNEQKMTIEEYAIGCENAYNYLHQFIDYDHMRQDVQSLYYLVNIDYISQELKDELVRKNIIKDIDFENMDKGGMELVANAFNAINVMNDYVQSQVRLNENFLPESIINVAYLCYDEHDRELVTDMHNNYFYAYKNGRYPNENFTKVFKQLTTLNAAEHAGNASELSVGARWIAHNIIGGATMQLLRDDMQEDFSQEELFYFFIAEELLKGQWKINPEVRWDMNCLSEHEAEVFSFGQLWTFVYDLVNNDLFRVLQGFSKSCCDEKCEVQVNKEAMLRQALEYCRVACMSAPIFEIKENHVKRA